MYHVWDKKKKVFLKMASNSYAKLGSVYSTYSGVIHALAFHANYPDEISNANRPGRVEGKPYAGWGSPENKVWQDARKNWWKANKHRPFSELFGPRYELREL